MRPTVRSLTLLIALAAVSLASKSSDGKKSKQREAITPGQAEATMLWKQPADLESRNLYFGPGGESHQPHGPFTFVEEDLNGTSPKFVVRDSDNVKWTLKLGMEARPETVASRLVWSVGYFTNEDYFLDNVQVAQMPARVKRGAKLIGADGSMHAARLKRHLGDEKDVDNWQWRDDPFVDTRELNGLKVMMALINNWDLKDDNNKLYADKEGGHQEYVVSDLGASFGSTGISFPFSHSKGDLNSYVHSGFISRVSGGYVDFRTPSRPAFVYAWWPPAFMRRTRLDGLVHHIPLEDVRWIGQLLSRLSSNQIHDAFRSAGYAPLQVDGFSNIVQSRIAALNDL